MKKMHCALVAVAAVILTQPACAQVRQLSYAPTQGYVTPASYASPPKVDCSLFGRQEQRQILQLQKQIADANAAHIASLQSQINQLQAIVLQQQQQRSAPAPQPLPPINIYIPAPGVIPNPGTPPIVPNPGTPPIVPNPGTPPIVPNPGTPPIVPNPGSPGIILSPGTPGMPSPGGPGTPQIVPPTPAPAPSPKISPSPGAPPIVPPGPPVGYQTYSHATVWRAVSPN